MISLRDLLWQYMYGGEVPTALSWMEIGIAAAIALLLLALYWVFQKIIFYGISDNARHARTGARVFAVTLAVGWILASLDLLGLWTSLVSFIMVTLVLAVDVTFLLVTRDR